MVHIKTFTGFAEKVIFNIDMKFIKQEALNNFVNGILNKLSKPKDKIGVMYIW